jgi:hypothetical protein
VTNMAFEKPVTDSVAKINHELAVGEDLDFQRRWWRFERAVWIVFIAVIVLDLGGAFGRGPLANAAAASADHVFETTYERIERSGTPSMMTVKINEAAPPADSHEVELFMSDSAVSDLGLQRVIPAPESTTVGDGGLTYRFPAGSLPATLRFEFQPLHSGLHHLAMRVPGQPLLQMTVAVVP